MPEDPSIHEPQRLEDDAGDSGPAVSSPVEHPDARSPSDEEVARMLGHTIDVAALAPMVAQQEAPDAADTLETLEEEEAVELLEQMDDHAAALALAEMQRPLAAGVIDDLLQDDPAYVGVLLTHMAPDDAADLLQGLKEDVRRNILSRLARPTRRKLLHLISHGEDTAGGLMTTDFIALNRGMRVGEAIDVVRGRDIPETMHHLLVTDDDHHLVGVVSLRDLLVHNPSDTVESFMSDSVRAVRPEVDQETVAQYFDRYDYYMLAVIDDQGKLLGIVTVDDVIDIIRAEHTEDVQRSVGAGAEEAVYSTLRMKIRSRFPWLFVNLFTSTIAAIIVFQFDDMIEALAILAVLMPVIANQAGNAGQQSLAVTLRGIVLDEVRPDRVLPLLLREALVGLINGLVAGILVGSALTLLGAITGSGGWRLGSVAAIAMCCALSVGCLVGSGMPLMMRRLGFDPATGSTIFLTMTTDSVSFLLFLGTARLLSTWLL